MNRKKLVELVKKEAKLLKKSITSGESRRLNFDTLDSTSRSSCIYGQITGHCDSDRAIQLIKQCCERVYEGWQPSQSTLNGDPNKVERYNHWSPIEVYILKFVYSDIYEKRIFQNSQNEKLVKYLKGELRTLNIQ